MARRAVRKAPEKSKPSKPAPRVMPAGESPAVKARTPRKRPAVAGKKPNLDRDRRTVREEEMVPSPPSSLDMDRHGSAARTGRAEFEERLRLHTSTGPAMTGGDVDAEDVEDFLARAEDGVAFEPGVEFSVEPGLVAREGLGKGRQVRQRPQAD